LDYTQEKNQKNLGIFMKQINIRQVISGSLLIAGTSIGAGMLGIPILTAKAGFLPALFITTAVWFFMLATGFLFLEATLWMQKGANILSITERFLGKSGKIFAGGTFIFLYYCLMIAYLAGGSPILGACVNNLFHISITGFPLYALFALLVGTVVAFGMKVIDRINYLLMAGLIISYVFLLGVGTSSIEIPNLFSHDWKICFLAAPVLFSAFGYHNIIPSLTDHFDRNAKAMKLSIFWGTLLTFIVYVLWQLLTIGTLPLALIENTEKLGAPITAALQSLTGKYWIQTLGQAFGFFALVTSLLGVAFSMVDFLGDGFGMKKRTGFPRIFLCLLTFIPPLIFTYVNPAIFLLAISIAGGFGEAFLNGILPVWLVYVGKYKQKLSLNKGSTLGNHKVLLWVLLLAGLFVMILEAYALWA
jgi:tyrosine-specific transport protein